MVTISALGLAFAWGGAITAQAQQPEEPPPLPAEEPPDPMAAPPEPTVTPAEPEVAPAPPIATQPAAPPRARVPHLGFFELTGAFGFQLGVQQYLPTGDGTTSKHPVTTGWAFGAIGGLQLVKHLFLIANYEYAFASSRKGSITNALDEVQGKISYHIATIGLRSTRRLGPGFLAADFSVGVLFPFETRLEYDYSPALAALPMPIEGSGRRTHEYGFGFGAAAQLGYQFPLANGIYIGTALRVHSLQANDNGEKLVLDNFVTDFMAPAPTDVEIPIDDDLGRGAQRPETYAVQAVRLQLALGYRF